MSMPGTLLFAQSFSAKEWDVISKRILDMNAENKMLQQNAVADMMTISLLKSACVNKDSVISKMDRDSKLLLKEIGLKNKESEIKDKQNSDCEADNKKQKVLKWIFIIAIPVAFEEGYRLHKK